VREHAQAGAQAGRQAEPKGRVSFDSRRSLSDSTVRRVVEQIPA